MPAPLGDTRLGFCRVGERSMWTTGQPRLRPPATVVTSGFGNCIKRMLRVPVLALSGRKLPSRHPGAQASTHCDAERRGAGQRLPR